MATITVEEVPVSAAYVAASSGGDYFDIDAGNVFAEIKNASGGTVTATLYGVGNLIIGATVNPISINDGTSVIIGPINPNRFKTTTAYGSKRVEYSSHTGVSIRAWKG